MFATAPSKKVSLNFANLRNVSLLPSLTLIQAWTMAALSSELFHLEFFLGTPQQFLLTQLNFSFLNYHLESNRNV